MEATQKKDSRMLKGIYGQKKATSGRRYLSEIEGLEYCCV